jgi:amino acid adenylation domain-containing protein/thioester reductase-like protein
MHEEIRTDVDSKSSSGPISDAPVPGQVRQTGSEVCEGTLQVAAAAPHRITPEMLTLVDLDQQQIDAIVRTVPGGASNVQDIYPLSPLQEGMLFHRLLNDKNDTYVLSTLFELESRAQVSALTNALQKVIDRHDILRSAMLWEQLPRPVQVVYRRAKLSVHELTLDRDRDPIEQLRERMRPGWQRLDVRQAPLGQLHVVADVHGQKWYALLQLHHLVCDHQSLKVVVAEAMACLQGREQELPAPVAYRSYVTQALADVRTQEAEAFFRSKLGEVLEPTAPFGLFDVHGDGFRIDEASRTVEPTLARQIRTQARRAGVSAARLFHAAWGLVVAHTSGRDDVVYGTVVLAAQQRGVKAQRLLGMSVNTLPLRLQLQGVSAGEFVRCTHQELVQLLNYEHAPLTLSQRCSGIAGAAPLFTTLLNCRHSVPDAADRNRDVRVLARGEAWTNYPVTILVDDLGDEFVLTAQTDRRIDPQRMTGYLHAAMQSLVEALEQSPQTPVLSLSILPQSERREVIERFNATQAPYSQDKLMHQLFEEQVERSPQAIAVVYEGQSLTYAELNGRANQLARYLTERGIGPDQLVGICVERSLEMVVGLLGILKAGGAYVPLDPNYPRERLAYMVKDAAPPVLLTQERLRGRLPDTAAKVITLDEDWSEIAGNATGNLDARALGLRSDHLAYVIYTSGSTGQPKGAMNEHRALINRLQWMQNQYQLSAADRVLQKTPFSFDVSVWEFFWTLMSGARLIVARPQGHQDPSYLRELIEQTGVTRLHFVPSMLQIFLDQLEAGRCPSLRQVVCSGEELSAALQNKCLESLPQVRLSNLYGPTEAAVDVTFWECQLDPHSIRVPIGRPISNTQMYVLDRYGQPAPIGVAAEIYIAGVGVGRGYLNRPELTAERFVRDPFSGDPQGRMYKTGDLGRWRADGAIEYLGRNDHQVKIRGFRIELGEIEAQLSRHTQLKEAVVIAREDVPGEKRLVAYVVPAEPSGAPAVEELRVQLNAVLPEHMVPSAFVTLDRMPLSPNGKLDRRALPAPELNAYTARQYEAPRGEVEEILAGIWQSLLRVERVGRKDNFFELGGHSLQIMQMMERVRCVGLSIELRRVLESPTLADLACALATEAVEQFEVPPNLIPSDCEAITPQMLSLVELEAQHIELIAQSVPGGAANIQDIYPLASLQEGILFHHLLDDDGGDTYILTTVLSVSSRERVEELIAAVQSVIDRHDVLRTAVLWEQLPRAVQVVQRRAILPVEMITLDRDRDPMEQVKECIRPERQRLDIRHAPLMRLQAAADPSGAQWYVVLQLHHTAIDHVTLEIVVSEVVAHLEGRAQALPASVPYRNHVAQSLAYARTHDAEAFFRSKLAEVDEPTAPFGLLDVHGDGTQVEEARQDLELALAQRVRTQARRLGVSAATLFHAAWGLVIAHTSGRDDVVFGSVLLGRLQGSTGAQQILGMFINTLPLRLQLQAMTARELMEQTQRELMQLLSHEQASLAVAQRCSGVMGSIPLFTCLLNYRHSVLNPEAEWSGARGVQLLEIQERTNYPVVLTVDDLGEGFRLVAQTDRRIDPQRMTGYLNTAVRSLVEALDRAPQTPALSLSILPDSERRQVIERFNATQVPYPQDKLIHQLFEEQVERTPQAVAMMYEGQSLTYAELNRKANQLARYLRASGVGPDQLVAICVERSLEMVIGLLGIWKAGGAYVPLDPSYPPERLAYIVKDAKPPVVLIQERLRGRLPDTTAEVIALDSDWVEIAQNAAGNLDPIASRLRSNHLAYVIYTSGSTGTPKGVMIQHDGVLNLWQGLEQLYDQAGACRRVALNASFNFDASVQQFVQLLSGRTLFVIPQECRHDIAMLLEFLEQHQIQGIDCTPSQLKVWIAAGLLEPARYALRMVLVGGEPIDPELWSTLASCGHVEFYNVYGPTECTVDVTVARLRADTTAPHIGRPMPNRLAYILDRAGQPVPIGVPGEIYMGGKGIGRGYLNRPELTAERFLPDPLSADPQARVYKTGDLGRWRTDGTIEYLGRNDDQVKIRGFRIELGEIESQLSRHEQLQEAVVIVREDVPGEKRLVAYVVPRDASHPAAAPSVDALRAHLKAALPDYMVPSAFVTLERLPLTPSGKVDRRTLPVPELSAAASLLYEAPLGEVEEIVAEIWRALLQADRVSRQDNFFELGGHSLLVLDALFRINQSFGCNLRVTDLYKSPTVRELAIRIGGDTAEDELVDLSREAALDGGIVAKAGLQRIPARAVLLTGGTGFVGRFLLAQLLNDTDATLYCLVRAQSQHHAASRLRITLSQWDLWRDEFEPRIVAVPGDLRLPRLGIDETTYQKLCKSVDSIYHCATSMNHLETYGMAKAANVDASIELLRLATRHSRKVINYISTLSIFNPPVAGSIRAVDESTPIDHEKHSAASGYIASKWVGEKIFMSASERGIPCNIFRLGLVWPDTQLGRYDELQRDYRVFKSCLLSGYGIKNYRHVMPPTAVDYVARAVVFLAGRHSDGQGIFHISSPTHAIEGIFERCNEVADTSLELRSFYDWICEIKRLHYEGQSLPVVPLVEFAFSMDEEAFHEHERRTPSAGIHFDCARTYRELEPAGIVAPALTDDLLRACVDTMLSRDQQLQELIEPQGNLMLTNREAALRLAGLSRSAS